MIKTLWFFIKISLLVFGAIWLISQPGEMDFGFLGYDIKIQTGVFLLILAIVILLSFYLLKLLGMLLSAPKAVAEYREGRLHKRGYRALTRGLVAVAAGDSMNATRYAKETQKLLKGESGLPLLLEAQAARLRGEEALARNHFEDLMKDKDTAFLGIRGLMKAALDEGDKVRALDYARSALKIHSNQGWIIKMVYALESKNHHWDELLKIGKKAEKTGSIPRDKIISDRIAIYLMRHDYDQEKGNENAALRELKAAYKLDPTFVPTVTRFASYYINHKKGKKAASLVEVAWKENPHPDLANIWDQLSPRDVKNANTKRISWFERLVNFDPDCAEGRIAAAKDAIDMGYWGEAKAHLMVAEKIYPTAQVFHLRAVAEQNITHNEGGVEEILEKATMALPEKAWTCQETGMVYDTWFAIAMPHESFNTIRWDIPRARIMENDELSVLGQSSLLIDPAA